MINLKQNIKHRQQIHNENKTMIFLNCNITNSESKMFFNKRMKHIPWRIKDTYNVIRSGNKKALSDKILTIGK